MLRTLWLSIGPIVVFVPMFGLVHPSQILTYSQADMSSVASSYDYNFVNPTRYER